ncbi:MAG TPA: ABC transporter ATP-binding protein [Acidimicrobiales bacterium]|nr:ABC transporter ATP-binding protein [Acidimicrobiales bacterium]
MPLLETRDVTVRFGGNVAVDNVSIGVDPGTVTGLIGPNGAGKTTLFNVITGLQKPVRGEVVLDGVNITGYPPYKRAQLGLARTFQRLELFLSLSVRDNIRVAGDVRNASRSGRIDVASETDRILELTGLTDVAARDVSDIPTGRARVVEVARALMTQPSVVLLDEPASGQTEPETAAFGQLLGRLAEDGLAICLVEHDVGLVMQVCSTITVLDYGAVIARGSPEQIRDDPAVIDAYLGTPEGLGPTEGAA